MRRNKPAPDTEASNSPSLDANSDSGNSPTKNPFKVVVTPKKRENPQLRKQLIELTDRLSMEAKNGDLKGLGGFADYGEGFIVGLEGSYLEYPSAAIIPIKILENRVIADVVFQED